MSSFEGADTATLRALKLVSYSAVDPEKSFRRNLNAKLADIFLKITAYIFSMPVKVNRLYFNSPRLDALPISLKLCQSCHTLHPITPCSSFFLKMPLRAYFMHVLSLYIKQPSLLHEIRSVEFFAGAGRDIHAPRFTYNFQTLFRTE